MFNWKVIVLPNSVYLPQKARGRIKLRTSNLIVPLKVGPAVLHHLGT